MKTNTLAGNLIAFIIAFAVLFFVGEVLCRFRFDYLEGGFRRFKYPNWIASDSETVWKPLSYLNLSYSETDAHGGSYPVHFSTQRNGFREWPEKESGKKKLFVIGDSFTLARQVSDDKTYYRYLANNLNVSIYAFGSDGYNSIQEWLILKRYINEIQPDAILWQFASNDLINNSPKNRRIIQFVHTPEIKQPFLVNGSIKYVQPDRWMGFLLDQIRSTSSRFIYFLASRTISLVMGHKIRGVELFKISDEEIRRGETSTKDIFRKIKKTAGNIPFIIFSTTDDARYPSILNKICEENGFIYVSGTRSKVDAYQAGKSSGYVQDGIHWNEAGHQIVAKHLTEQILNRPELKKLFTET